MQEVAFTASCYQKPERPFVARMEYFDASARSKRALQGGGMLFLLALVVLPIPIVHFSVPVLLIAATVVGLRRLREEFQLESVSGPCPACARTVTLSPSTRGGFPVTLPCPECGEFLKLAPTE